MENIGILDPAGINPNPLTGKPYSDEYKKWAKLWSKYPAYEKFQEVLGSINDYPLTFVISGTGSGKTVLIPKFALHHTGYQGKIAITLPKRVVTLSAATFSALTLDVPLGTDVGYVYKGSDKKMASPKNKLTYMTDGTLIMKFVKDPYLSDLDVVIIDEAHERKVQIDLILLFLKNLLLSGKRPDFRVIIMSATIDGEKYQKYFEGVKSNIVNISGQPNYEITTHFLDRPSHSYMIDGLDRIEQLVKEGIRKDILFFITTSSEALQLCKTIRSKYPFIYCIEVYADMEQHLKLYAESRDKYLELGNYEMKLVIATNVAESSLTIDGLKYVIDSDYELYSYFDPSYYAQVLEKRLITKAQALQRRGRVGRTEPGICYHLLTEFQFDSLDKYPTPDILKQDITMDLLKIIQITPGRTLTEGIDMLNRLMDTPRKPFIDAAITLYELYEIIDGKGKLNKIGYNITQFSSLNINRALFLIYSYQLHCAKEVSIILAMMEVLNDKISNIFMKADTMCDAGCRKKESTEFLKIAMVKKSDHLTYLKIYQMFVKEKDQKVWARKYGLRLDLLNKAEKIANQYFYKMLSAAKSEPDMSRIDPANINSRIIEALKMSHKHLVARHMMPNFITKEVEGGISKESIITKSYSKKDLFNKKFIYDALTLITGSWEFNVITII